MRMPPRKYLIAGAALALLGAGVAQAATAKLHTMEVDAPDGAVVQVQYTGKVAPRVRILPVDAVPVDVVAVPAVMPAMADPFVEMARVSAIMDAHMQAMMQRAALVRQQAARMQQEAVVHGAAPAAPGFTLAGDMPRGMHVTYYSSTTDASGCTRTISYSSDGSGAAPRLTKAASDGCDAAAPDTAVVPAKAVKPAGQPAAPGQKV
ncbi:hypothetical protein [Novosphingobium mangrovi (ex Huang et al. 2023)]|uniref:Uncharacterized protein n=1 Tax=Novosphingobium mangrovi (ex Huang et al. 2023) TaxID=2976432 RepID=A0ABT2I367_9SPHN|nr:hypothetical protein [Novosphingobium mangrovi (ex Huang et al. 2023)]MCT2399088.1 hypothetical protein [Novosphingobium mangrovi (ex Huang et al. 2023)]